MDSNDILWYGYLRKDGRKGIRNKLLIIYTVECSAFVAREITQRMNNNDVEVVGFAGCTDNEYAIRMLIALCKHPNVGAVLAIGLGCEYIQADRLARITLEEGKIGEYIKIQEVGGTKKAISKGVKIANSMLKRLKTVPTTKMNLSDLVVGAECGGSDYTSGLAGNLLVGKIFDEIIDAGGCAIFEEILEAVGLVDVLCKRAISDNAEKEIRHSYAKALDYCKSVRQYSVSPGNFAGGLSTIEEKSMGAIIKSGSRPIQGVIKVSEKPPRTGLWLMDSTPDPYWMEFGISNPNDNEGIMDLISAGCQLTFLITGRGNVIGSAVAPVIKVTGNANTFRLMEDDMDFNAAGVLEGKFSVEELTKQLLTLVIGVSGGKLTKGEILGHKEFYIPYKYQNKTCREEA